MYYTLACVANVSVAFCTFFAFRRREKSDKSENVHCPLSRVQTARKAQITSLETLAAQANYTLEA